MAGLAPRALKKDPNRNYATHPPSWSTPPPPSSSHMLLELFKVEGTILDRLRVGKRPVHSFGRNSELCTHALDHGSISRQHALIVHTQHGPYLVDLHSSQGTRVNGEKVEAGEPVALFDDDVLSFGASGRKYRVRASGRTRGGASSAEEKTAAFPPVSAPAESHKRPREGDESAQPPASSRARLSPGSASLPERIAAVHLLLKHTKSRRPSSHKGEVTRTPEEARQQLTELRERLVPHLALPLEELLPRFEELAREHSDCSSYKHGGALGRFNYGQMQKKFSDVAFRLRVGEVSDVLDTDSGVHIILRTS